MDLLDKIKKLIKTNLDKDALFDLIYDDQKSISGYIATDLLLKESERQLNNKIWKIISQNISKKEQMRIIALFTETLADRIQRLETNNKAVEPKSFKERYFVHRSKDGSTYFGFIDIAKFEDKYKTFYLTINADRNFRKGMIYNYTSDVIAFMNANGTDIFKELYENVLNGLKASIRIHLMDLYEKQNILPANNVYNYVYDNFILEPIDISVDTFNAKEKEMIIESLKNIFTCPVTENIKKVIDMSNNITSEELT
jgi:hypothetical protein